MENAYEANKEKTCFKLLVNVSQQYSTKLASLLQVTGKILQVSMVKKKERYKFKTKRMPK